ncbi:MAG TPA: rod shape-determining protein MreD [Rectinemataceae bacterium]
MIKTIAAGSFLAILFLVIQTTWLKDGLLLGIIPDFSLLVLVWISYMNSGHQGIWVGFISGLACDILSSSPLGYFSFIFVAVAYIVSLSRSLVALDAIFLPALLGFLSTLVKALGSMILLKIFGEGEIRSYEPMGYQLWVEAASNGLLAPLVFFLMGKAKKIFVTRRLG